MAKLVYCLHRNPELTRQQFQNYWLNSHAALVKELAQYLGAYRYVQSHTVESGMAERMALKRGLSLEQYDGVTEFWWRDNEPKKKVATEHDKDMLSYVQQRLLEDESIFIDFTKSTIFMTEEHEVYVID